MIIGYARVSSKNQNLDRQIKELKEFGCEQIFQEKESGKNFKDRTVYQNMKDKLRFGDVLVIHDLSRLGRSKEGIKEEWRSLTKPYKDEHGNEYGGIDIVVLNMPILDTRQQQNGVGTLINDLVFSLLSWMVEEERERIRANQREGIEIAKQQGKYKGRSNIYRKDAKNPEHRRIYFLVKRMLQEKQPISRIADEVGISRNTVYRIKKDMELENEGSNLQ